MSTPTNDADTFQVVQQLPALKKRGTAEKPLSNRQRLFRFLIAHPNQWVTVKTRPAGELSGTTYAAAKSYRGYGFDAEVRVVDDRQTLYARLTVNVNGGEPQ